MRGHDVGDSTLVMQIGLDGVDHRRDVAVLALGDTIAHVYVDVHLARKDGDQRRLARNGFSDQAREPLREWVEQQCEEARIPDGHPAQIALL